MKKKSRRKYKKYRGSIQKDHMVIRNLEYESE